MTYSRTRECVYCRYIYICKLIVECRQHRGAWSNVAEAGVHMREIYLLRHVIDTFVIRPCHQRY